MKKLLQRWHLLHTWTKWEYGPPMEVIYPWTQPGYFASIQRIGIRSCVICEKQQTIVRQIK